MENKSHVPNHQPVIVHSVFLADGKSIICDILADGTLDGWPPTKHGSSTRANLKISLIMWCPMA